MYPNRSFRRKHKRADIKWGTLGSRNPVLFIIYNRSYRLYKHLLIHFRHTQTTVGIGEAARIHFRAKQQHPAILCLIGLQPLKGFLCIMQNQTCRIHADRRIRLDLGIAPAPLCCPIHGKHMVGKDFTKAQITAPVRFFFFLWCFYNFDIHIRILPNHNFYVS